MLAGCFSLAPFLLPGAEQLTWLAGCRSTPSPRFTPSRAPSSTLRPVPLCTGINWITQPVLLHKIGPLYSGWGGALPCQDVGLSRCSVLCHYLLHLHTALALSLSPTPQASERARCVFPRLLPIYVRAVGHSPPAWQRPSRSSWDAPAVAQPFPGRAGISPTLCPLRAAAVLGRAGKLLGLAFVF